MDLILNPKLKNDIEHFLAKPTHALLLVGPLGSGKGALLMYISAKVLGINESKLTNYPHFLHIRPSGSSISIDEVRSLHNFTSLKTPGNQPIRRVIIIEELQTMTNEAQNAYLKLLEEPPRDTVFIMAASDMNPLLPTVLSRTRKVVVSPPDRLKLTDYFKQQGYADQEVEKALNIANGLPGLAAAILESDDEHVLVSQINSAKRLISSTMFDRLLEINNLAKDKEQLPILLMAMRRVSRAMLTQAAKRHSTVEVKKWHTLLSGVMEAEALLDKNPQPKLLLTNLFMQF